MVGAGRLPVWVCDQSGDVAVEANSARMMAARRGVVRRGRSCGSANDAIVEALGPAYPLHRDFGAGRPIALGRLVALTCSSKQAVSRG